MDSLSTNPDEKQPDQSQPAAQPADSASTPESPKAPDSAQVPEPAPTVQMPDETPVAATPKIDLANPGTAPESKPVPPPPVDPAPTPKKDLAGYEAIDAAAVLPSEARPSVMAQTAKPRRSPLIWIVLAVIILAALGGGAYWYLNRSNNSDVSTSPSPSNGIALTSPSPSATPEASVSPSPSDTPSASPSPSETPTATPSAPQPANLTAAVGGNSIAANQNVSVSINRPVFSGNATPGNTVTLTISPENIGLTATADTNGAWNITPQSDLPNQ
jgi:hypothetical protein